MNGVGTYKHYKFYQTFLYRTTPNKKETTEKNHKAI